MTPETYFLIRCRTLAAEYRMECLLRDLIGEYLIRESNRTERPQKEKDKADWERLVQPQSD